METAKQSRFLVSASRLTAEARRVQSGSPQRARRIAIVTATGPIYLSPGRLYWAPVSVAWLRMRELHLRALGKTGPFTTAVANQLTPPGAFRAYSNSAVAVLAQIAVIGPKARIALLKSLCEFVAVSGSLDGLVSVFLSCVRAAQHAGNSDALIFGAQVLSTVGLPGQLDGGALTTPVFDVGTGQLCLATAKDITQALGNNTAGLLSQGSNRYITGRALVGMGMNGSDLLGLVGKGHAPLGSDDADAFSGLGALFGGFGNIPGETGFGLGDGTGEGGLESPASDGATVGAAVGGTIGAIVGASSGGLAGAAAGATVGAAVGGTIGAVIGWATDHSTAPGHGDTPAPGGEGDGHGDTPAPGGKGDGHGPPVCLEPDGSTGLPAYEDGSGGGVNWAPTAVPSGPGLESITSYLGGRSFLLTGLPAFDDNGSLTTGGFLSGVRGYTTIDTAAKTSGGDFSQGTPGQSNWRRPIDPDPIDVAIKTTHELLGTLIQQRRSTGG
jgi:hypothetical protein